MSFLTSYSANRTCHILTNSTIKSRVSPTSHKLIVLCKHAIKCLLKKDVENLFEKLGLSTTEAISLFYNQVKLRNGLPFDVVVPNKVTKKVFKDTDVGKGLIRCEDTEDMCNKLGI